MLHWNSKMVDFMDFYIFISILNKVISVLGKITNILYRVIRADNFT